MNALPVCPVCKTQLPIERLETPWCECGWSFVMDEAISSEIPERITRKIEKDRRKALQLANIDAQTMRSLNSRWRRVLWRSYLFLTILACIPVLLIQLILWTSLTGLFAYFIIIKAWPLAFITGLIMVGALAITKLTEIKPYRPKGILLTPQSAPQLFCQIDQMSERLLVPRIHHICLQLDSNAGITLRLSWHPLPTLEPELTVGLLTCYALSISQFNAVIAHELGHLQNKDAQFMIILSQTLNRLDIWTRDSLLFCQTSMKRGSLGAFIPVFIISILHIICKIYLRSLIWVSRAAMRRQEYLADQVAARISGKAIFLQSLISLTGIGLCFKDYIPIMLHYINHNHDTHDFYYQFTHHWESLSATLRQKYYARAVASFRSVYDTHPSYTDRRIALEEIKGAPEDLGKDDYPAESLIQSSNEMGRELTVQLYKFWQKQV